MENIGKNIGNYLNSNRYCNLFELLDFIARTYGLDIFQKKEDGMYDVRGNNDYEIVSKTIFTLIRLEQEQIISYYKQVDLRSTFSDITHYNGENPNCGKIDGYLAQYINTHLTSAIYVNEKVTHFAKHGFSSPEYVLAKRQTSIDFFALGISILAFIVALLSFLYPILKDSNCI